MPSNLRWYAISQLVGFSLFNTSFLHSTGHSDIPHVEINNTLSKSLSTGSFVKSML